MNENIIKKINILLRKLNNDICCYYMYLQEKLYIPENRQQLWNFPRNIVKERELD